MDRGSARLGAAFHAPGLCARACGTAPNPATAPAGAFHGRVPDHERTGTRLCWGDTERGEAF